jgi:hypothetical protein
MLSVDLLEILQSERQLLMLLGTGCKDLLDLALEMSIFFLKFDELLTLAKDDALILGGESMVSGVTWFLRDGLLGLAELGEEDLFVGLELVHAGCKSADGILLGDRGL